MTLTSLDKQNILSKLKGKKIAVLYGGISEEREVSLRSGSNVYEAIMSFKELRDNCILIDVQNHYDVVEILKKEKVEYCYNILHGTFGEDGSIQGLLDCLGIKYTGENTLLSALCMNKVYTKRIWKSSNISTVDFILLKDVISVTDKEVRAYNNCSINYPMILKPICSGSSVGVSLIHNRAEFDKILYDIGDNNYNYFIEPFIKGREVTVGISRGFDNSIDILPLLGINSKNEIYDYDAKYTPGKTELEVPAKVSTEIEELIKLECSRAYEVLGCEGLCRIDVMIGEDNSINLMEINTQGGMTNTSDIPAMAKSANIAFEDIILYVFGLMLQKK